MRTLKYKRLKLILSALLLIATSLPMLPSTAYAGTGKQDQCGSSNTCSLVCNDGTVLAYNRKKDGDPDTVCKKHKGAELLVSTSVGCDSTSVGGSCDANHCTKTNCTVTCGNLKDSKDITAEGGAYTPTDPIKFCQGKGGVAVIINKDGTSDVGNGADQGGSNDGGACDPAHTDSVACACKDPAASTVCNDPATAGDCTSSTNNCDFIRQYVNPAIQLFSVAFGLFAVISLIVAGINYSMSEGDPQKSARAKSRIVNTVIAIVAYLFLYAFLQFLVPGGLFNRTF